MKVRTALSDISWIKKCRKKIYDEIEDRAFAQRLIEVLDADPELRRDLVGFYLLAKERLTRPD
ncbi:hypothetical protein [Nitrospira sp. Kam-Ns4a]